MIYKVALCEDEKILSDVQERICRDLLERLGIPYSLDVFDCGEALLAAFTQGNKRFDLFLLDIVMDRMDGMELARKVREADENAAIVFVTSHPGFALEGYDVKALHYLLKPLSSEKLENIILRDYQARFQNLFLVLESGTGKYRAPVDEILFLETSGRKVDVTLTGRVLRYPGKLTALLSELPGNRFVRCHQGYAVNLTHVRELTKQSAIIVTGKEIPVSRTFAKEVQKAFARQLTAP